MYVVSQVSSREGLGDDTGTRVGARAARTAQRRGGDRQSLIRSNGPLLSLSWAHLLNDGASNYLPGVLPAVLVSLHDPVSLAGVLTAALIAGQAAQPLTGWLADRLGGRLLSPLGLMMSSIGGGLVGVAHTTGTLIVLLLVIGIGGAFFHPQALAGVRRLGGSGHGMRTSVFLVGGEIGRGLWPTAASIVVEQMGLIGLWVVAVPGLLTVPLLLRAVPKQPRKPRSGPRIDWRAHRKPTAVLLGYQSMRAVTTYTVVTFIPILWHLRGGSLTAGASIITTLITVGVLGNLAGGHLSDRIGRRPVLLISAVGAVALVFPVAYLGGAFTWISAGLLGMALFMSGPVAILIGQDIFPANRSMGSGVALGLGNAIGAALVLLIGLFVSDSNVIIVFWVAAALGLVTVALVPLFPAALVRRGAGLGSRL